MHVFLGASFFVTPNWTCHELADPEKPTDRPETTWAVWAIVLRIILVDRTSDQAIGFQWRPQKGGPSPPKNFVPTQNFRTSLAQAGLVDGALVAKRKVKNSIVFFSFFVCIFRVWQANDFFSDQINHIENQLKWIDLVHATSSTKEMLVRWPTMDKKSICMPMIWNSTR